jgi:signal transduction histidine kinase
MSEEVKAKIFQPFFTTKGLGEGTGLGLSITFGIIDKHKGKVTVDSEKGKGTIFTIVIPKQHQMLSVPVMATVG